MGVLDKRLSQMPPRSPLPRIIFFATIALAFIMFVVLYENRDALTALFHRPPAQSTTDSQP